MTQKTPASKENYSQSENKRSEEYGETLSRIDDATKKTPAEIIMTQKIISKVTLEQKFKQMYSSEIVPLLKQKKVFDAKISELDAKINELYAKISELYAKKNELYAKKNELYAKKNELYAKISELDAKKSELDAKILWKFVKFEKDNNCKTEWDNYNFELKDIKVKSNVEIEAEKNKVPEEITQDGHTYKLIS